MPRIRFPFTPVAPLTLLCLALVAHLCGCSSSEKREKKPSTAGAPASEGGGATKTAAHGVGKTYSGRSLELEGDFEGAVEAYRAALEKDPSSAHLTRSLARVEYKAGNVKNALSVLSSFLKSYRDSTVHLYLIDLHDRLGNRAQAEKEVKSII
ncbi:MAG: tetratricopeptide repeat protein, partial [Planctomycetota bacterium]